MRAYTAKEYKNATADLTLTTHGTITELERNMEDIAHKPYMDN